MHDIPMLENPGDGIGSTSISYFDYMKFSFPISINHMMDYLPSSLAFFILGQKDQLEVQSTIGFGLTYIIFTFGYAPSIVDLIGLQISSLCDSKKYKEVTETVGKALLCIMAYILGSILMGFFSKEIMLFLGIEHSLALRSSNFIKFLTLPKMIEIGTFVVKSMLISQKITGVFMYVNLVSVFNLFFFSYLFMYVYDFNELGYFLTLLIKTSCEMILFSYSLVKLGNRECFFIPSFKSITNNIGEMFTYSVNILIGNYGEWTAVEVNSYFAALMKKVSYIVAWSCMMNVCGLNYLLGFGEVAYLRTHGSIAIGMKNKKRFDEVRRKCLIFGVSNHIGISILVIIFAGQISSFYTSDPETHRVMTNLLYILSIMLIVDWSLLYNSTSLRLINLEQFQFRTMALIFPIVMVFFSLVFAFGLNLEVYGLLIGFTFSDITVNIIMHLKFAKSIDSYFEEQGEKEIQN